MHVFQKKVFSPRPEASLQVYFNANTHLLKLGCKQKQKLLSPGRDAPFRVYFNATQTPSSAAKFMWNWISFTSCIRNSVKFNCSEIHVKLNKQYIMFTSMQHKHLHLQLLHLQRKSCDLKWIWTLLWAFDKGHEQTHFKFVCVWCSVLCWVQAKAEID